MVYASGRIFRAHGDKPYKRRVRPTHILSWWRIGRTDTTWRNIMACDGSSVHGGRGGTLSADRAIRASRGTHHVAKGSRLRHGDHAVRKTAVCWGR